MLVKKGDIFELDSVNGHHYTMEIINVNELRPPEMIYACDIWMDNNRDANYYNQTGDYYFCGINDLLKWNRN